MNLTLRKAVLGVRMAAWGIALISTCVVIYSVLQQPPATPLPQTCEGFRQGYLDFIAAEAASRELYRQHLPLLLFGMIATGTGVFVIGRLLLRTIKQGIQLLGHWSKQALHYVPATRK